jgi:ribosomal protein L19
MTLLKRVVHYLVTSNTLLFNIDFAILQPGTAVTYVYRGVGNKDRLQIVTGTILKVGKKGYQSNILVRNFITDVAVEFLVYPYYIFGISLKRLGGRQAILTRRRVYFLRKKGMRWTLL